MKKSQKCYKKSKAGTPLEIFCMPDDRRYFYTKNATYCSSSKNFFMFYRESCHLFRSGNPSHFFVFWVLGECFKKFIACTRKIHGFILRLTIIAKPGLYALLPSKDTRSEKHGALSAESECEIQVHIVKFSKEKQLFEKNAVAVIPNPTVHPSKPGYVTGEIAKGFFLLCCPVTNMFIRNPL